MYMCLLLPSLPIEGEGH